MAIHTMHNYKVIIRRGNKTVNNPFDRSKLGTKRQILTDKKGIPLSAVITSAKTHDLKAVTNVIDNSVIKQPFVSNKPKGRKHRKHNHICFDRAYQSKSIKQEIINCDYVPHTIQKKKIPEKRRYGIPKKIFSFQK